MGGEGNAVMPKQYRCECCNGVEWGDPMRICPICHSQFYLLKQLAADFRKRFDFGYLDVNEAIRAGVNKLVERINQVKRLIK